MKIPTILAIMSMFLIACGSGDDVNNDTGNESTLGSTFQTYMELSEASNDSESTSEITPYLLDLEGIKIHGTFESSGVSLDYYRFNTGTYSRVDVHVFIDGVRQYEENSQVSVYLNNYIDDGYSTLFGNGYFINASVSPTGNSFQNYVIGIRQNIDSDVAGSSYIIEVHHNN